MPYQPSRYEQAHYFVQDGLSEDVVPAHMPPPGLIAPDMLREFEQLERRGRVAAWTVAALAAFEDSGIGSGLQGFRFATFGLGDPISEERGLAVFCYVDPIAYPWAFGVFGPRPSVITELAVGEAQFKVFLRSDVELRHISLHPANASLDRVVGTTGCVAQIRSDAPIMLMTAKHVVEDLLPTAVAGREWVPMKDETANRYFVGRVHDKPPGLLDAVLIEPTPAISLKVTRFTPPALVVNGDAVVLELRSAGKIAARVVEVKALSNFPLSQTPPNLTAVQIFVDQYGVPGDSGSLIVSSKTTDGVALYTGAFDGRPHGLAVRGVGQYLGQVAEAMGVELLKE